MIGLAFQEFTSDFTPAIDIGWRLKRNAWGRGYAIEGAKRCLEFAFNELAINKIISVCTIQNSKSENIIKKIVEFNHSKLIIHPEYEKHLCYEILKPTLVE